MAFLVGRGRNLLVVFLCFASLFGGLCCLCVLLFGLLAYLRTLATLAILTTLSTLSALRTTLAPLLHGCFILLKLLFGEDCAEAVVLCLLTLLHLCTTCLHLFFAGTLSRFHLSTLSLHGLHLTKVECVECFVLLCTGPGGLLNAFGLTLGEILGIKLTALAALRALCEGTHADDCCQDGKNDLFHKDDLLNCGIMFFSFVESRHFFDVFRQKRFNGNLFCVSFLSGSRFQCFPG